MGVLAAGFTTLCLYVGEVATAEPSKCLTETKCQPIVETDCSCVGEKQTEVTHAKVKYRPHSGHTKSHLLTIQQADI